MHWFLALVLVQVWQEGAPMPTPGYSIACAAVNGRVFAIGGLRAVSDSLVARPQVEAYDAVRDTWFTDYAPLPVPRWYVRGAVLSGRIYVIGGFDGRADFRRVDRFDPARNRWDTVAPLPWPRSAVGVCAWNGSIYVAGGFTASGGEWYQRTAARFIPDSGLGRWDVIDSMNTPRTAFGLAVAGDRAYAVGGKYFSSLSSVEYYTPDNWQNDNRPLHDARSGHFLLGSGEMLCAIGGTGQHGSMTSVEMLNTAAGPWYQVEGLRYARSYLGAAYVGDRVVVVGGWSGNRIVAETETDSVIFQAVQETSSPVPLRTAPPTLVRARLPDDLGPQARVYDSRGRLVTRGPLATGVYLIRQPHARTAKLTVVR